MLGPTTAMSPPATAGPIVMPVAMALAMRPLAQARSSGAARFGIAALEAGMNGISATVARKASATSSHGSSANATATKSAAATRSETIITRRRSKRSPIQPPSGIRMPWAASVTKTATETHVVDPVRS